MFRLLPWSSAIGGNKVMAEEFKMLATPQQCAAPGISRLARPPLKRKRSDSNESAAGMDARSATRLRPDKADNGASTNNAQLPSHVPAALTDSPSAPTPAESPCPPPHRLQSSPSVPTASDQRTAPRKMDVEKLRETIESQLSLEILLKHNELRLIDQEIAKCQVALEQLRRCAEIPYPGSSVVGMSQSVSNGSGIVVTTPRNGPAPLSPAPWGVTNGPYTSHYAKWLLPDRRFDGGEVATSPAQPLVEGRTTRASSGGDGGYMGGKSRPQRGSAGAKLQSLPSGYPQPKDKVGPMVIRRKSDGVWVKLVCLDCRRDNFSSTQGFINHCRIAHNRNFASHDAAATASGEPVEVDETGAVVGKKNESPSHATPGYVHPLIRSAHVIESTSETHETVRSTPRKRSRASQLSAVETPTPAAGRLREGRGVSKTAASAVTAANPSFTASPDTPHLSSLMQLKGVDVDLDQLVGEAKTAVDIDTPSEEESDAEPEQPSADTNKDQPTRGRQPMRTTTSHTASHRQGSRKGIDKVTRRPRPLNASTPTQAAPYTSPYGPVLSSSKPPRMGEARDDIDTVDNSANLSPNTVVSNQAPSLVSDDDDDYEATSDSESPSPSSSEVEDDDQHFGHIEVEDDEATTTSTNTDPKTDPELASAATHHAAASLSKPLKRGSATKKDRLLSPSIVRLNTGKGGKHVDFVSPDTSPAKEKKGTSRKPSQRR